MAALLRLPEGSTFAGEFLIKTRIFEAEDRAVYVAEQKSTGREVALKVLSPALLPDEEARRMFLEGARIGGKVKTMHVLDVRGVGIDEASGLPWVATELLEGENLDQRIRKATSFPLPDWDELLSQVLRGLASVHQVGACHGGLNGASIFLATSSEVPQGFRVELLDFGLPPLAQMKAISFEDRLAWAAPEALDGGVLTPATDVWALGLLAFLLLTGKPYFQATERAALEAEIRKGVVEPASVRARSLGAPPLPQAFDAWFARCLHLDPAQRFPSANEAREGAADLLSEVSGLAAEVVESEDVPRTRAKPPPLPPMVRVIAENPKPAIAVIALLILLALGGGFGLGALQGGKKKTGPEAARAAAAVWFKGSLDACKKACDNGDASACHGLGQMYQYGTKTAKDEAMAAQYFELACSKQDVTACASLAHLSLSGEGVRHQPAKAVELFHKACEAGDAISCSDLADMLSSGNGVPKDEAAAASFREKACKAGMMEACK
ncbi:MAG: serine/threonine-protein kinase [Myxococcales bacterium]|nr:serine/threonine-protein kinase [Polyangiaceae bacterium]MDW8249684.1 serine/threonine-protein kinase [Myxococcales bacterium]